MTKANRLALTVFVIWLFSSVCYGVNISADGRLYPDAENRLNPPLVLERFRSNPALGFTGLAGFPKHEGNYWFVASLKGFSFKESLAVRLANAHFKVIDYYLYSGENLIQSRSSGYRQQTEGLHTVSMDWVGKLNLDGSGPYYLVIYVSSPVVSSLNVNIEEYEQALVTSVGRTSLLFFMVGIAVSLAFYNLILGINMLDSGHILYAVHSFFGSLFILSAYGLFKTVFGFYDYELYFYKPASVGIQFFGTWFCYVFLQIPKRLPKLDRVFKALLAFYVLLMLAYPLLSRETFSIASAVPHPFFGCLMIGSAWLAYRQGLKPALYLFIGWTALILASTMSAMSTVGLIPGFENILLLGMVGHVFEMYMLSLAIAKKFKSIQMDSIATQELNRSRSAFISYFSHEIKTPITGMLGLGRLLKQTPLSVKQNSYIEQLERSANQLLQQLSSVLLLESGLDHKPKIQATSPVEAIATSMALIQALCEEKGVLVETHIDENVPLLVNTAPDLLQQILNNLLSNAAKYTNAGHISVHCSAKMIRGQQVKLIFVVEDSGIGIPYDEQDKVFGGFVKASNNNAGILTSSGMGLAVVKRLCEQLQGSISYQSELDVGSRFEFEFEVEALSTSDVKGEALKILVVDDVELNTEITAGLLMAEGHEVVACNDPVAAIELARNGGFDTILLDIHMPTMSGEELFTRLSKYALTAKIIGISAGLTRELSEYLCAQGMTLLMEKPFSLSIFYGLLNIVQSPAVSVNCEVDNRFFDDLRKIKPPEELSDFLSRFTQRCKVYYLDIEKSCLLRDSSGLIESSHGLSGVAAALGLVSVSRLARRLEGEARDQFNNENTNEGLNWPIIEGLKGQLESALLRSLLELKRLADE